MSSRQDLVGSVIADKYLVKRRIGAGGMGAVYEGEHREIGKIVAIKVIEIDLIDASLHKQVADRFKLEARATSAVASEHIVQVFDVGEDPTAGLFMVMEYLEGEDLSTYLERHGGKLPLDEGSIIVAQAARGLAKAHAAGVIHRDLKPANLFLTRRDDDSICVKVVDFGISKLQRPDDEGGGKAQSLTREGSVVGTPIYMSPEQAQGLKVDGRTDVWSLGALLYEVLSGRPPYEMKPTYEQMIIQIVTTRVPSLADVAPWVPQNIREVIERALSHDLNARTPDAGTFSRELAEAARMPAGALSSQRIPIYKPATESSPHFSPAVPGPPTGTGVAVLAIVDDDDDELPKPRRTMLYVALGAIGVGAVAAAAILISISHGKASATATAAASPPPSASVIPIASASAPPPTPPPSTSVASRSSAPATSAAAAIPNPKKRRGAAPATSAAQPAGEAKPNQYGAAGVSTAY